MMVPVVDVHGTEHARVQGVGCRVGAVAGAGVGVMRGDGPTVEACVTVRAGIIEPPQGRALQNRVRRLRVRPSR